ncbi:MAG TPA: POTRA domain-containing protein, partial [Chthoniobacterales bacterium]
MRSSGLFLLLFVATAWAQLTPLGPQAVYEGQTVVAVDLIANPHRDVEPLRPLVSQKEGQPYSQANIEASVRALEQKGGFPKVNVNVLPEPSGLRLNFLLEPAYYLGIVAFPGAVKVFSYTRLLQVVNLPDEDPYDRARLPIAETALQNFLQKNGYFQAKIQTKSEIDDAHQLVNVSFIVEPGKQARIGRVDVQGPDSPESSRLLHAVRSLRARFTGGLLKSGKPYTPERMSAATVLIKRMLSQQRHLASSVQQNPPQYHAETNRVDVSFKIEVGPVVIVRTTGARLSLFPFVSGRQLKKLIPIYSEGTIDRDLVNEGQQNLVEYFQKKGFFDASVKVNFKREPNQILLVYEIDRGKKHKVDRISFQGNRQISADDLLPQVVVKRSHIWSHGAISQKLLRQSVTNLQALYRDRGYESIKVTPQVTDHEPKIDVAFTIEEGPQTLVDNIQVTGNDNVPYEQLTAPKGFELRSGTPFSARRLSEDRNRISATYLNRGYLNAEVKTTVSRHPD